ncbi:porin [Thalassobacter stenotrophicus]|nr:porin [Thalassobacter stenotrophicus]
MSGYAELGITDDSPAAGTPDTSNTQFHTDVDVTFSMTGETDSGLSFGVSVDLDEAGNLGDSTDNNGTAIFLSGAFGTLTVGDTDGAMDFALTEIVGPGSLTDQETSHDGFKGSYLDGSYDGQIARYDYTAGDLSVAVSAEILDTDATGRSSGYGVGVKYVLNNITLGAGVQKADLAASDVQFSANNTTVAEVDATGLSVSGTFGAVTAGLTYVSYDSNQAGFDADHTSVGISYTQGAMTIGANYGDFDSDTNAQDRDGMALTANYSLGGGATLQAGYETSDGGAAGADRGDSWSLGLAMSF